MSDWLLRGLLLALLIGALTFDRSKWSAMIGDESTYLMAAESLAWDLDLTFERHDYERFVEHWRTKPDGLILQSGNLGERLTFGKPFFYPLWIAPFVRLWPTGGPFLANALLLAIAALLSSRALRTTVGNLAPVWVATFLFASVAFGYTFWAHADLFLLALVAVGYSLTFEPEREGSRGEAGRWGVRWVVAGVLLAVVVFSRPFYLPLMLPPLFALPKGARGRTSVAYLVGALTVVLASVTVHKLTADSWTSYGAQRRGFTELTGFPEVDFPAEQWQSTLESHGDAAWAEARSLLGFPPTSASLWRWNGLYFFIGRHIGVVPYFLPLILGLLGRPRGGARWMLLVAVALSVAAFFLYRPFNIYGGGGAVANRYFMPLYPALWFLATRPCGWPRLVAIWLVATPFLWPLWSAPRAFPQRANHTYRYVSPVANRNLPFETTQSHLKPSGREDVVFRNLWIKFLAPSLRMKKDGSGLLLNRGSKGELLVGSHQPLSKLELVIREAPAETVRVVSGAAVVDEEVTALGRRLELQLGESRAEHPMWWTWNTFYLYQLELESLSTESGRLTFTLRAIRSSGGANS